MRGLLTMIHLFLYQLIFGEKIEKDWEESHFIQ